MAGEYLEQRILGMVMVKPDLRLAYPDLDTLIADDAHQRIWRTIRDCNTTDLLVLSKHFPQDIIKYLCDLRDNESICPENFPGYVRALKEINGLRAYTLMCNRLRPLDQRKSDPFKSRGI